MTTDFPTAPPAYGLEGPSAGGAVGKSLSALHTKNLTSPASQAAHRTFLTVGPQIPTTPDLFRRLANPPRSGGFGVSSKE